jgi:hypothetical protein
LEFSIDLLALPSKAVNSDCKHSNTINHERNKIGCKKFIEFQLRDLQVYATLRIRFMTTGISSRAKVVKQHRNHPGSMQ